MLKGYRKSKKKRRKPDTYEMKRITKGEKDKQKETYNKSYKKNAYFILLYVSYKRESNKRKTRKQNAHMQIKCSQLKKERKETNRIEKKRNENREKKKHDERRK